MSAMIEVDDDDVMDRKESDFVAIARVGALRGNKKDRVCADRTGRSFKTGEKGKDVEEDEEDD